MIDLHAHILPGLDDGPGDWDKALLMLRSAVEDGIKGIAATPHVRPGLYDNPKEAVLALTEELKGRAKGLPIEIYPGSELMISPETLTGMDKGLYCTINQSRYMLIELPTHFLPSAVYDFVFAMTSKGLVPIVAHPERNPMVIGEPGILYEMVRLGCLTQITAASVIGLFGHDIKRVSHDIVKRRLAHVLASDAHDRSRRPPKLSDGVTEVSRILDGESAMRMVAYLPEMVINDKAVEVDEPVFVRKKGFFFF